MEILQPFSWTQQLVAIEFEFDWEPPLKLFENTPLDTKIIIKVWLKDVLELNFLPVDQDPTVPQGYTPPEELHGLNKYYYYYKNLDRLKKYEKPHIGKKGVIIPWKELSLCHKLWFSNSYMSLQSNIVELWISLDQIIQYWNIKGSNHQVAMI